MLPASMTTEKRIDLFCTYFEREAAAIGRIITAEDPDLETGAGNYFRYRMTLYVTAIDTLAGLRFHKSAYPQLARHNRERFIRFLKEYGSWPEGDLVSLPFLKDELESLKLLNRPLARHIIGKMSKFSTEDDGPLQVSMVDEPLSALLALTTTAKEEDAANECQHLSIFYRYRNALIHESREPGNGMGELFSSKEPSYGWYIGDSRWYLSYPLAVFEKILERSIAGFRAYLVTNQIDPYSLVEEKACW